MTKQWLNWWSRRSPSLSAGSVLALTVLTVACGDARRSAAAANAADSDRSPGQGGTTRPLQVPEQVPGIKLVNVSGDSVPLYDPSVRYTALHFGGIGCRLCRQTLANVVRLRDSVGSTRMRATAVVYDEDRVLVQAFAYSVSPGLAVLRDPERRVKDRVTILGSPTIIVVDSTGQVMAYVAGVGPGVDNWQRLRSEFLDKGGTFAR